MWTELWGALRAEGLRDECAAASGQNAGKHRLQGAQAHFMPCLEVRATVDYCGSLKALAESLNERAESVRA